MAADLRQALELPAQVISLRRSIERRAAFAQRNGKTGLDYVFVDGVDGLSSGMRFPKAGGCPRLGRAAGARVRSVLA